MNLGRLGKKKRKEEVIPYGLLGCTAKIYPVVLGIQSRLISRLHVSFSNADSCPGVMTLRWVFFSHRCFPFPCPSSARDTREPCPFPLVSQLFLSSCVPMPTQPPLFGGISLSLQKVSLRCYFFPDPPELVRFFCFIFIFHEYSLALSL